ncbi:MAG: hypothetical protein Unbinned2691contig1000_60 [Prokaryotic dsDNA virus sp.]|nr:MAG: hypothetical protein Unbinned2691contig1000_60 [Prokaryotic dsDNA virus sp.]|tara:strand:- start:13777 stop:14025 length:249 start_codon:yes stop_codon:yes gene_type:complete
MLPENHKATINGYGVIEADTIEAVACILSAIGDYKLQSIGDEGRTVTFTAPCRKTYIARLVSKRYGYPEDGLIWNCRFEVKR